jgi:hypothetical protein
MLYEEDVAAGLATVQPCHPARTICERSNEFASAIRVCRAAIPVFAADSKTGKRFGEPEAEASGELGHDPAWNASSMVTVRGQTPKACSNSSSSGDGSSVHRTT